MKFDLKFLANLLFIYKRYFETVFLMNKCI